jgi:dihydrofolate synthase / folylpolyglutamate synthase
VRSLSGTAVSSTLSAADWLTSLSPWPKEFGLERMQALSRRLGDPQLEYPSIHVVGTNGKGTATRTIEELLTREGLDVGGYYSPHVRRWSERIRVGGAEADFDQAVERIRPYAQRATQFEVLTAAAFVEFREQQVDVAVIEAGLGGRWDATNVIDARVVLLTNVGLDHTDVLGETRELIAAEKLAVVRPGAIVVLGEPEWAGLVGGNEVRVGGAREAAEAFLGRAIEHDVEVSLPGRLEWRGENEVWDGAHNPMGLEFQAQHLPARDWIVVASILEDKDVDAMLELLGRRGRTFVATRSTNERALDEKELARRAEPYFERVETVPDPQDAVRRARELGPVLVTGSLYLLADLCADD